MICRRHHLRILSTPGRQKKTILRDNILKLMQDSLKHAVTGSDTFLTGSQTAVTGSDTFLTALNRI